MPIAQKFVAGLVATMMITTLILPKRQTPQVINALTGFVRGTAATAMGTGKSV